MYNEQVCSCWFGRAGFHMWRGRGGSRLVFKTMAGFALRSREKGLVRSAILCLCLLFIAARPARPQGTFTTFDVPGAGTGVLQGTLGVSINAAGISQESTLSLPMWLTALCAQPMAR